MLQQAVHRCTYAFTNMPIFPETLCMHCLQFAILFIQGLAYRLMDTMCPFPVDVVAANAPLSWKVATALGKASSLHCSCTYVHNLIMFSLPLNGLMAIYS